MPIPLLYSWPSVCSNVRALVSTGVTGAVAPVHFEASINKNFQKNPKIYTYYYLLVTIFFSRRYFQNPNEGPGFNLNLA